MTLRFIPRGDLAVIQIDQSLSKSSPTGYSSYSLSSFKEIGITEPAVQINQLKVPKDTIRGLHYQINPFGQGRLVRVLRGSIYYVVVDIRHGSPNFGKWIAYDLSTKNSNMIYTPSGFAYGLRVRSSYAEIQTVIFGNEDSSRHLRGIKWNDPQININWGIENPRLSQEDASLPKLSMAEINFIQRDN